MAVVSDYTALLSGNSWTGLPGQAAIVTYSFSTAAAPALQSGNAAAAATFLALNDAERTAVRAALAAWSTPSGLTFHEVAATPGDITFGMYDLSRIGTVNDAGLGYAPSTGTYLDGAGAPQIYGNFLEQAGDIYFDRRYRTNPALVADFAHVAVHEIGHALGLKHPFEGPGDTLAPSLDTGDQTVMSYTGARTAEPGPLDIAAIQYLYGTRANAAHPFVQAWHADREAITVMDGPSSHALFGSGGDDVFYAGGGRDAVGAAEGDDIVFAQGAALSVNGGPGRDRVVTGLAYQPGTTAIAGTGSLRYLRLPDTLDRQVYVDVKVLDFTNGVYDLAADTFSAVQPGSYAWTGMTNQQWATPGNWRPLSGGSAAVAPGAMDAVTLSSATVTGGGRAASVTVTGAAALGGSYRFGALRLAGGAVSLATGALIEVGSAGATPTVATQVRIGEAGSLQGYGSLAAAVLVNEGAVVASGGTLRLSAAIVGTSGAWTVAPGATLWVPSLPGGTVTMQGTGSTLRLDAVARPLVLTGFDGGDRLLVAGASPTSVRYQATGAGTGTLAIGGVSWTVLGDYAGQRFMAADDGAGGVRVSVAQKDELFDDAYYLARNGDVAAAGIDPWAHYQAYGRYEGRTPNAWFDPGYYLARNADVAAAGVEPLLHFETYGWREGREPSLLFSDARYNAAYGDVAAAAMNPLRHYMLYGQNEGRMAFLPGGTAPADPLVDAAFYDRQLGATLIPAGLPGARQAAWSYDTSGWQRGLDPDPWFDTSYYLARYADVAAAHINPLLHYETYGWREGRDPSPAFSTAKYLTAYADVAAARMNPLLHYVSYGQNEGRAAFAV